MKFTGANIVSGFVPVRGSAVRPPRLAAFKMFFSLGRDDMTGSKISPEG